MTFTVTSLTRCAGTNHITISISIGGVSHTETFLRTDLDLDMDDAHAAVVARLRSAVKEASASTAQQISTALLNKTFQV